MFNLAEVWGFRPDGTNPCRHVPMYPAGKFTHLISDLKLGSLTHADLAPMTASGQRDPSVE
ncbi:MAG: hypothetical protein ACTH5V_21470 [Serratia proteamaculans]